MLKVLLDSLSLALVAPAAARPFTPNDMVSLDRVSSPTVSPDGKWMGYQLRSTDLANNRGRTDLYLLAIDKVEFFGQPVLAVRRACPRRAMRLGTQRMIRRRRGEQVQVDARKLSQYLGQGHVLSADAVVGIADPGAIIQTYSHTALPEPSSASYTASNWPAATLQSWARAT